MQSSGGSTERARAFLARLILGAALGQTPEEFAAQEMAIMEERGQPPKLCRHGLPNGCCAVCFAERRQYDPCDNRPLEAEDED